MHTSSFLSDLRSSQMVAFATALGMSVNSPHEVRVMLPHGDSVRVVSGVFTDPDRLPQVLAPWRDKAHCLISLNPLREDFNGGEDLNVISRRAQCAKDADIDRRRWLLIDVDAVRPPGFQNYCSSDEEFETAIAVRDAVDAALTNDLGITSLKMISGNGAALLVSLDGQAFEASEVQTLLQLLASKFDTKYAKIDCKVHNASRLTRIAGSVNVKPADETRHRRIARLENPEARPEPASPDVLRAYAKQLNISCTRPVVSPKVHSATILEGQRHSKLMSYAGALRRQGLSESRILEVITSINAKDCTTPLEAAELASIARSTGKYEPAEGNRQLPAVIITVDDVEERPIRWLWSGYLPLGKLVIIDGDPNRGKSFLTLDLAARVSRGDFMPDGSPGVLGNVLLLSTEDAVDDTIKPRLRALGADLRRVQVFQGIGVGDEARMFELGSPDDMRCLEAAIVEHGVVLIVLDPLIGFFPDRTNTHRDQDVRRALTPLVLMAQRTGVVVIGVRHLNKMAGPAAMYRGSGSIAIIGAARSAYVLAPDPDDPDLRVFAQTKTNLAERAPSLAFRLEAADDGIPRVRWVGTSTRSANELVGAEPPPRERPRLEAAEALLMGVLGSGPREVTEMEQLAAAAGIAPMTLRRARESLGVITSKCGAGWRWTLPGSQVAHVPGDEQVEPGKQLRLVEKLKNSDGFSSDREDAQEQVSTDAMSTFDRSPKE